MNLKHKKMNKLTQFKNSLIIVFLLISSLFYGQNKYVETFDASKDMVVEVNTSYTNIIFDTWNKNKVQVEAFIDDDKLTEAEKQKYFDTWKFNVLGNSKKVVITSNSHGDHSNYDFEFNFDEMEFNMEFLGPLLESIEMPVIPDFEMPEMPEHLMEGISAIKFDYEAFKENEEEYMKVFEKQMEENFGPEFEEKMEAWGEKFGKEWEEKHGPEWEAKMEAWGEKFGEEWEEKAAEIEEKAAEIEVKAEEMAKEYEEKYKDYQKLQKVNKTIIIRMPKNTKTDVNVRHGELKMADAYNVKATLNYSPFTAISIDGGSTLINATYAPVTVDDWVQGSLNLNYVEECSIKNVKVLNLQAISSDVLLGLIEDSAVLSGSISHLQINKIADNFSNLNIILENTEALITLPKTNFSFIMNGSYSELVNPKSIQLSKNNTLSKSIAVNAAYSSITVQ